MTNATSKITDDELRTKLKESYIADEQKKELETLIPEMKDEEKTKLLNLIEQSKITHEKAQKEYQENLQTISDEHSETLRKEDKNFRKEFEQINQKEETEELKEVEAEIATVKLAEIKKETKKAGAPNKRRHSLRNLFIILIFLILIAAAAIYGIKNL